MKKSLLSLLVVAMGLLAASCEPIEQDDSQKGEMITITASFDASTKTVLGEGNQPYWDTNEREFIWLSNGTVAIQAEAVVDETGATATFQVEREWLEAASYLYAKYPYDAETKLTEDGREPYPIEFEIPKSTDGSFKQANICVSYVQLTAGNKAGTEPIRLKLRHATAVYKMQVSVSNWRYLVYQPKFPTLGRTKTAGTFRASLDSENNLVVESATGNNYSYITLKPEVATTDVLYMAFPAINLAKGVSFGVYNERDEFLGEKVSTNPNRISMGHLYNLGVLAISQSDLYFSVDNNNKIVLFAPGNLRNSIQFNDTQYENMTNSSSAMNLDTQDKLTFNWLQLNGEKINVNGVSYNFLTFDEWSYVTKRADGQLAGLGQLAFKPDEIYYGLFLLPDNFADPKLNQSTSSSDGSFTPTEITQAAGHPYGANKYDSEGWEMMEERGAVFLPATGYGYYDEGNNPIVADKDYGYYWCWSVGNTGRAVPCFNFGNTGVVEELDRAYYLNIRPVRVVYHE